MKVLFLTPYYPPEVGAPQTRIQELARRLVQFGHEVSILTTFPNYPSGIVPKKWRGKWFWKGVEGGIQIYRVWSYAVPNSGFLKRIFSQLSFALSSCCATRLLPNVQAVVVESPPLFDGFAGIFLGWAKRAPYLFTVADLWPETAVQLGVLRNPLLIWAARRIEHLFYRRAALILAITAGIQRYIVAQGVDSRKVILFRNAVDPEFFRLAADDLSNRPEFSSDNRFIVLYAGTMGMSQDLEVVLETAAAFQGEKRDDVQFLFVGNGSEREALRLKARAMRLDHVEFLDSVPKVQMPALLSAAGCIVIPLHDIPAFRWALPTKLFEAMSCSKPVILAVDGEAAEILTAAGGGLCIPPGDAARLQRAINQIMADTVRAAEMGKRGRKYILQHFSRDVRARELSGLLDSVVPANPQAFAPGSST